MNNNMDTHNETAINKNTKYEDVKDKKPRSYSFQNILDAREERVKFKDNLIRDYHKTVIMMRVNYPGIQKDNMLTRNIMNIVDPELRSAFKDYIFHDIKYTAEGPVTVIAADETAYDAKKKTVNIEENHILGRCLDIDVYDSDGKSVSRTELGLMPRKCYICDDAAQNCVRSQKHNKEEIIRFINEKYIEYLRNI